MSFLKDVEFIHFTSWPFSLSSRGGVHEAGEKGIGRGIKITFDPNYRRVLWDREDDGSEFIKEFLKYAFIVKPSEDDALHIFGTGDPHEYIDKFHNAGASNVVLTLGHKGSVISDGHKTETLSPCARRVVDTTGAGDAFWSGILYAILQGRYL